jgi:biotin carboxyl carrier protein
MCAAPAITLLEEDDRAMEIKSPAVGKVLRLSDVSGAQVARGDEVMVIESMKVEIPVKAPAAGRIAEFRVKPGDQIQRNVVLAILEA